MMQDWDKRFPGRLETMFTAIQNVSPSHLADTNLFDFAGLIATGQADPDGDTAFDKETFAPSSEIGRLFAPKTLDIDA